jgi:foldase protein PrsA
MAKSSGKRKPPSGRRARRKGEAAEAAKQTRKQIAFGRKQARQNRMIWLSVIALASAIVLILGIGFTVEGLIKPNKPVAIVNDTKIRTADYQSLLTQRRYNLHVQISNLESGLEDLDPTDETGEFLQSFYQQQISQLELSLASAPQDTLDELIEGELIQEKAEELQLSVTPDRVDETITTLVDDLRQSISPPQEPITGTELTPTPTALPRELVYDLYLDSMGLSDKQFRTIIHRSLLRDDVANWFASQVVSTGLVVHVQLIQTKTEEEAVDAQARIVGGEEFAVVAQEVSTDTLSAADGGDLGWVTTGQLAGRYGEELENTVFAMDVGDMDVVQSAEMYYVVQVLERDENGPLPEEVLGPKQDNALNEWLTQQLQSPDVQIERLLEPSQIPDDPFVG